MKIYGSGVFQRMSASLATSRAYRAISSAKRGECPLNACSWIFFLESNWQSLSTMGFGSTWKCTLLEMSLCRVARAPDLDSTGVEWTEYVERNRGFLESNWHILGIDQWRVPSYGRGPDEYRDVLMLEAAVQSWNQRDGWPPQWYRGFFPYHFAFFGFPHDGPPLCD